MRHSRSSARTSGTGDGTSWIAAGMFVVVLAALVAFGWWILQPNRSQEVRSQEPRPQEVRSQEPRSEENRSQGLASQEIRSQETRSQETRSQEPRSQEIRPQETRLPLSVGAAFDISGSMQTDEKDLCFGVLSEMIDTIMPSRTPHRIWVYAEKIHRLMDIRPIDSSDPSLDALAERIKKPLGEKDTYQKLALQALLDYAKAQPDRTVVLCLFTDGEDHTREETRRLAEQISQQPNVRAVLVGPLEEGFQMDMEERLGVLKDKLILFGRDDIDRALDELSEKLAQPNKEVRQ